MNNNSEIWRIRSPVKDWKLRSKYRVLAFAIHCIDRTGFLRIQHEAIHHPRCAHCIPSISNMPFSPTCSPRPLPNDEKEIRCRQQPESVEWRWRRGEWSRFRYGSCANAYVWRYICPPHPTFSLVEIVPCTKLESPKKKKKKLYKTHRIVFPVRNRIHWGIGRFCFCAFASFCFVRKDLWDWRFIAIKCVSVLIFQCSLCCERGGPPSLIYYYRKGESRKVGTYRHFARDPSDLLWWW